MTLNAPLYCRTITCVMAVLFIFNLPTKFECLALSAPKIWLWLQNVEMSRVTLTTPTSGQLVIIRLILNVANPGTKFKVSSCSRCRDISRGRNIIKCDPDHAPFRDDLSSTGWDFLSLTYRPNLMFLTTDIKQI